MQRVALLVMCLVCAAPALAQTSAGGSEGPRPATQTANDYSLDASWLCVWTSISPSVA